jgi:sugar O-acyltransferase (sialic acid O-acetyltransferase NeuD family)
MRVVLWGGTGQAKVVAAAMSELGCSVVLVIDRDPAVESPFAGVPILHDVGDVERAVRDVEGDAYVITIGGDRGRERLALASVLDGLGLRALTVIHPKAWVDPSASIGSGSQIAALAGVGVETTVGSHCIINTAATIDHECSLGDGVHVMPGATVAGCVSIGDGATIGSGATVLPRLVIGPDAVVGAGAVVTRTVQSGAVVVGVPARPMST